MWIKYKFRSSLYSETLNIHGRNSISAGELRCKILRALNLGGSRKKPQDFDLVLYDEVSGQEYKVNDFKIPSGSSVIVKRIPARHVPSPLTINETHNDFGMKDSSPLNADESLDIFDFGADPLLDTNLPEIVLEFGENNFKSSENEVTSGLRPLIETVEDFGMKDFCPLGPADESMDEFDVSADWRPLHDINFPDFGLEFHCEKEDIAGLRLECQKLERNDLSQVIPKGSNQRRNKGNILEEPKVEERMKLDKPSMGNFKPAQNTKMPVELICSLCNTCIKEAVMIPCCQYSFCEKCIRWVLIEKERCPKCSSSECKVEDLLPNLTLRGVIEHFIKSQMLDTGLENAMQKYAPDGESGIQPVDNPQPRIHIEADSKNKETVGSWIGTQGMNRILLAHGGHEKGAHNSYTGVSPHHLMRDCPVVSNPNPMSLPGTNKYFPLHMDYLFWPIDCTFLENGTFHGGMPGYPPTYRGGSTLSPLRPYENLFGSPTKMPFNDSMVPMTPFAVPSRIPFLSNALHGHVGIMEAGSTRPPQGNRTARPHGHSVYSELQYCVNKKKCPNEKLGREQLSGSEDGVSEKDSRSRVVCDIRVSSSHKKQPSNLERTSSQHLRRYELHDDSQQMATGSYEYYRDEYGDRKCKRVY